MTRKFISISKTQYREELLKKARKIDRFKGMSDALIFEKILEQAIANPNGFDDLFDEDSSITMLKEINKVLGQGLVEIATSIKGIHDRLDRLENNLIPIDPEKEKSIFDQSLEG